MIGKTGRIGEEVGKEFGNEIMKIILEFPQNTVKFSGSYGAVIKCQIHRNLLYLILATICDSKHFCLTTFLNIIQYCVEICIGYVHGVSKRHEGLQNIIANKVFKLH